jgi:drug/metabolite transporter (DMT)-like permease
MLWGLEDALSKKPVDAIGISITTIIILLSGLIPIAIIALFYDAPMTNIELALSSVAGIFWGLGFILIYKSVSTENVTSTYVINEILPAAIILFGVLGLKEHISSLNSVLMAFIFIGAVLVMLMDSLKLNKRLLYALFANFSWAVFWILMITTIDMSRHFAMPLLIARVIATAAIALFFIGVLKKSGTKNVLKKFPKRSMLYLPFAIAIFIGVIDGLGNDMFGFVSTTNLVALGGGIIAISPIVVALLGRIWYKDRLVVVQWIGFGIMVIAAILMALF